MIQKIHRNNMVWIDMEMSGLDPEKDKILEIATIITDGNLNVLAEGPDLVIHQPSHVLKGMDEWNQDHHAKSGLMDAVRASTMTVKKAEQLTLEIIQESRRRYCRPAGEVRQWIRNRGAARQEAFRPLDPGVGTHEFTNEELRYEEF